MPPERGPNGQDGVPYTFYKKGVNCTSEKLAALSGPDSMSAPNYGIGSCHDGSSFITPVNHERLFQAEARKRKKFAPQTVSQPADEVG
jgi:hypothetical protein